MTIALIHRVPRTSGRLQDGNASRVSNRVRVREGCSITTLRFSLIDTLRRFLATKGFAILRIERASPINLESYVRSVLRRGIGVDRVCLLDGDPEPVRILLNIFGEARLVCCSAPNLREFEPRLGPTERVLLEIDAAALRQMGIASFLPRMKQASVVIIRSKLGCFWSRQEDALNIAGLMQGGGFRLRDVMHRPVTGLITPMGENIYFAFEREDGRSSMDEPGRRGSSFRVAEALNQLCTPIATSRESLLLTGRGSFGMQAGICNPGAVQTADGLVLLARGERIPWPIQRRSWTSFASSCQPMVLVLQDDLQISKSVEARFDISVEPRRSRSEDFRLFTHNGQIYANHSTINLDKHRRSGKPVFPETLEISVGISRFDLKEARLTYLGSPRLERPIARIEKNWAMFSTGRQVQLIYSFNPYRMYSAEAFPELNFTSTVEKVLRLPIPDDGLTLRNSINPVSYDSSHFLHIVHKVYPNKQYVYWGVLIDRTSLLPSRITARPLLRGIASAGASILYACSAIARDSDVLVFAGIDDCSIGAWSIPRPDLDRQWRSIA